jgi:Ca2+-binding RTX toxin-like protein
MHKGAEVARIKSTSRARTGVLAGAAAVAALAFPGIASAAVNSSVAGGVLTVTSDAAESITVTCATPNVKVNGDNPGTGPALCADITSIVVTGGPGANTINLAGVNGTDFSKLASVTLNGGAGTDTIHGSQLADRIVGGDNNDDVNGNAGNDTLVWNGGDDDDINDGDAGVDTIEVNGAAAFGETFAVKPSATAGRVQFDRLAPTPTPTPGFFNLDIGTSEQLDLRMNGGDDTFTADQGLAALGFKVTVDGGDGTDSIDGSDNADLLRGGNGNDRIVPDDNPPNTRDDARGDAGDDTIVWNGGDDDDLNDGGAGNDTTQVNGATANETFTVKPGPNGHVIFDRTAPTPDPPGFFNIDISTTEKLDLNMNAGDDTVTADPGFLAPALDVDGGDGNDRIDGSDAADTLAGGNGDDNIVPDDNPAGTRDVARGDAGNDTIVWNGGDDDDINDGGDGTDTSVVNGATTAEKFTIKPGAAGRVSFDRVSTNPAPFNVDIGTTELLRLNANGGNDKIKGFAGVAGLIETELNGEDGNDEIRGTDAEDRINGGKGHDLVNSRDHAEDLVDCGAGFDLAFVDRRDFLRNCNIVIGGFLRVKVPAKTLVASHGVAALRIKCAGTKHCKGVVRLRSGGKTLAAKKFTIKQGSKTIDLKLNRRGLRLLDNAGAKGRKVSVQIDAQDAKGNGWRSTDRIRLKD